MKPAPFAYHAPTDVNSAVGLLQRYNGNGRLLAGGQSLLPEMLRREAKPSALVDLQRISTLRGISVAEHGAADIGAMTSLSALAAHRWAHVHHDILSHILGHVGNLAIRNAATLGGSASFASPRAEVPVCLVLLRAQMIIEGPEGSRAIAAESFFQGPHVTAIGPYDVLTRVHIASNDSSHRVGWGYRQLAHQYNAPFVAAVACFIAVDPSGSIAEVRVVAACIGEPPTRLRAFEEEIAAAGRLPEVSSTLLATPEGAPAIDIDDPYHRQLVGKLTLDAARDAVARCGE